MKFLGEGMMYLGFENRESKKTGNPYMLVKVMDQEDQNIFEMYVGSDRQKLNQDVAQLKPFTEVDAGFEMKSFQNKAQVDLVAISPRGAK